MVVNMTVFKLPKSKPSESSIESKGRKYAQSKGHFSYKFVSPSHRSVPDRLNLAPVPEWLRPVIAKYVCFIEYKKGGKEPTDEQAREHERLRDLGYRVEVIDNVEDSKKVTDSMGETC
jgi:hypothetical protein